MIPRFHSSENLEETGPELMMDIDFPKVIKECVSWTNYNV